MEKRRAVDLQAITVQFENGIALQENNKDTDILVMLYLRAMEELGFRRKSKKKPSRVYNAPQRKTINGVTYGK